LSRRFTAFSRGYPPSAFHGEQAVFLEAERPGNDMAKESRKRQER
jgi:hypothetical protein